MANARWQRTAMKDCAIRSARSDDAEAIADVHLNSRREAMPWLPVLHSREEAIAYFAGHVLVHEEVLVAEVNELVVGFMALEGDHVDHLYIAPSFQSRGIGHKLLAMAMKLRPGGLTLWTFQRNTRARRFYEARGFVASEFNDGSRNEEREPDVRYAWLPNASSTRV
jgi:ribosomal protein S18 acetylase RimI-like enzyme